jgi:hypothetical protein
MNINEEVKKLHDLSYDEQLKHLESMSAHITENEWQDLKVQIELFSKGVISEIKPPRTGRIADFPLLKIKGKPLSQIIIEDREPKHY